MRTERLGVTSGARGGHGRRTASAVAAVAALVALAACGGGSDRHAAAPSAQQQQALAAHASPATWEDLDPARPGRRLRDPRTGIVFVRIPAGEFDMGSTTRVEQQPVHRVRITRPFLLAETEVTAGQWQHHVQEHGGDATVPVTSPSPQHPMFASWDEAAAFCARYGYRLPTEAEWDWACRGGVADDADACWNDERTLQRFAWFHLNAGTSGAQPVGRLQPNGYGLFDMLGNVWEWCADRWSLNYTPDRSGVAVDPAGPAAGGERVLRGGSWFTLPEPRPHTRVQDAPYRRMPFFGFRPARDV